MINREELRKKLPSGSLKEVAKRAGVGVASVSRYFSYESNSERVEIAALEVAAEIQKKKQENINLLNL